MRLVFLHGIHQDGRDPNALRREWIGDLEAGIGRAGALANVDIEMPFYGDALVAAAARGPRAIAQGPNEADDRELALFVAAGLEEQAKAAGATSTDIAAEQQTAPPGGPVDMGFPMHRRINAIVNLLERISPLHGDLAVRLLAQAHAYLRNPHVRTSVNDIVRPALERGPCVLVTHSLGTVVGFVLLRERALTEPPYDIPLLLTMGSPLTLSTVQRAIGPAFANPAGVERWLNIRDADDLISLNRGLDVPLFPGPIENVGDFENPGADAHAIPGYLAHASSAQAIAAALAL